MNVGSGVRKVGAFLASLGRKKLVLKAAAPPVTEASAAPPEEIQPPSPALPRLFIAGVGLLKAVGDRGGKGYYNAKGKWRYGDKPGAHADSPRATSGAAHDQAGDKHDPSIVGHKTTHRGDEAHYTGKTRVIHGGLFHELDVKEGHQKGEKKWTMRKPGEAAAAIAGQPDTMTGTPKEQWVKLGSYTDQNGDKLHAYVSHGNAPARRMTIAQARELLAETRYDVSPFKIVVASKRPATPQVG